MSTDDNLNPGPLYDSFYSGRPLVRSGLSGRFFSRVCESDVRWLVAAGTFKRALLKFQPILIIPCASDRYQLFQALLLVCVSSSVDPRVTIFAS